MLYLLILYEFIYCAQWLCYRRALTFIFAHTETWTAVSNNQTALETRALQFFLLPGCPLTRVPCPAPSQGSLLLSQVHPSAVLHLYTLLPPGGAARGLRFLLSQTGAP